LVLKRQNERRYDNTWHNGGHAIWVAKRGLAWNDTVQMRHGMDHRLWETAAGRERPRTGASGMVLTLLAQYPRNGYGQIVAYLLDVRFARCRSDEGSAWRFQERCDIAPSPKMSQSSARIGVSEIDGPMQKTLDDDKPSGQGLQRELAKDRF